MKLPKLSTELICQIEDYHKAIEKAEAKGIKSTAIQKTVAKLKFRDLTPRPRPQSGFAVNKDLMLDREKNTNGNLDVRLKVSYQKRPNSIGQVLVPIELYDLVNEHADRKKATSLLLIAIQKGLQKSFSDGNVHLVCRSDDVENVSRTKKEFNTEASKRKKKAPVKKKSVRQKTTKLVATKIPTDRFLKRIVDPDLGSFKYREDFFDYLGQSVSWCEQTIWFHLSVEEPTDTIQRFEAARKVWKAQKRWHKKAMAYAASELLELANEWQTQNERKTITQVAFKRLLHLTSIEFFDDGDIMFWYDTDDLFDEKGICVQANLSGEFLEATND